MDSKVSQNWIDRHANVVCLTGRKAARRKQELGHNLPKNYFTSGQVRTHQCTRSDGLTV